MTSRSKIQFSRDRYGYKIDGESYRRVSTYLAGIPKPWLGAWAANTVAEWAVKNRAAWSALPQKDAVKMLKGVPWSKRDDAGRRGQIVHEAIEAYLENKELPDDLTEEEFNCAVAVECFLKDRGSKVLGTEITVFSPEHRYAGTFDMWETKDGDNWIIDWKTSAGVYPEHAIQQVAYRHAQYAIVDKEATGKGQWVGRIIPWGPEKISRLGIVHVTEDKAQLYPIIYTPRLWSVFRAAAHIREWQLDTDNYKKEPREEIFERS